MRDWPDGCVDPPPPPSDRAAVGRADAHSAGVPRLAGGQDRPAALGQGGQSGAGPAAEAAPALAGPPRHRPDHPRERLVQTQTAARRSVGAPEGPTAWG